MRGDTAPSRSAGQEIAKCLTTGIGTRLDGFTEGGPMYTLNATGVHGVVHGTQDPIVSSIAHTLGRNNGQENALVNDMSVRRLTPVECERLQGFPDGYTNIAVNVKMLAPKGSGPCAKQTVTATFVSAKGTKYFKTTNYCLNPQATCPRGDMPTGVGYELCKSVCKQEGHAELNALRYAGAGASGGTIYVEGHTYACKDCQDAANSAGATIVIGKPIGNAPDGSRYKALGNSMAVPVMQWIAKQIDISELF